MSYTLSLVGNAVLIESDDANIADLDFPLQSTVVLYDNAADEIQFIHVSGRSRTFKVADIANEDLDTIDLVKDQVELWRASATAGSGGGGGAITSVDLGVKNQAAATDDTGTFSVIQFIKRALQNWTTLLARIPELSGGRIPVNADNSVVLGKMRGPVSDSFARPANVTGYAIGDAIQNSDSSPALRKFAGLFPAGGGSGYLSLALIVRNSAMAARLRVHLYNLEPVNKPNDNAAFAVATADEAKYLGYLDLESTLRGVACSSNRKEIVVGGEDLFYQIETLDAFTPASGTNYLLKATLDSNI